MTKFSDYINSNDFDNSNIKNEEKKKNLNQDDMEDLIHKYSSYNQSELINEFMKLTQEKKKKGELNRCELNSLKQTILPFLNDEQKNNLDRIMNMVDNVK